MLRFIFRTSWKHMVRIPYASAMVVFWFLVLFLTLFVGLSMIRLLEVQKGVLTDRFTYPLFISNLYTFESPRVKSFVESLPQAWIHGSIHYVTKEQALDQEIQKNPNILSVLSGQNPLPDMIMIPLYGTDITVLWKNIQEYRDIFDSVQSFDTMRTRLKKFENAMEDINHIVGVLALFAWLTVLLMAVLVIAMIRYHVKMFHSEIILGRLVWADPLYFWGPHIVSIVVYAGLGFSGALIIFGALKAFL